MSVKAVRLGNGQRWLYKRSFFPASNSKYSFGNVATSGIQPSTLCSVIRLVCSENCFVTIGINPPTASSSNGVFLKKREPYYFGVDGIDGVSISVIRDTTNGTLYVSEADITSQENEEPMAADVTGPSSSTDNAITRFDGITGKLIQNSNASLDDSGKISTSGLNLSDLSADMAIITDVGKNLTSSSVSATELSYLTGASSNIQTQISAKGDASGPASSTDNALARFDGTTGKLIQNSSGTLDDSGKIGAVDLNLSNLTASRAIATDSSKNLVSSAVTATELGYLSGVSSAIQTQISSKGDASGPASSTDNAITRFDGTTGKLVQNSGTTLDDSNKISAADLNLSSLIASRAIVTDGSKNLSSSTATSTEVGYLSGVSSAIQTQLNAKGDTTGPGSSTDNAITRFDGTTGKLIQNSGATLDDTGKISALSANLSGLTASKVVVTDASKNLVSTIDVSAASIEYMYNVTGNVQNQLDAKADLSDLAPSVVSLNSNITLNEPSSMETLYLLDSSGGSFDVTLYNPKNNQKRLIFVDTTNAISGNTVNLLPHGSESIQGAGSYLLYIVGGGWTFIDCSDWWKTAQ